MSRRLAREMALQVLFQLDFNNIDTVDATDFVFEEHANVPENALEYAHYIVKGALESREKIDEQISRYSTDWKIDRMNAVDRNILRIAIFEMMYSSEKLSPSVAINEAVEIAKNYGTEDSSKFINGILGSLARNISS